MNTKKLAEELKAAFNSYTPGIEAIRILEKHSKYRTQRLKKAISECQHTSLLYGTAELTGQNELQAKLQLTILPLNAGNANRQGVEATEADNILNSILYMPVRANFYNGMLHGHDGSDEVGTIISARNIDNVITAEAILWKERNEELLAYISERGSVPSSFEIYYRDAVQRNGIEWLQGVVFASQCLVQNPAYQDLTPARLV